MGQLFLWMEVTSSEQDYLLNRSISSHLGRWCVYVYMKLPGIKLLVWLEEGIRIIEATV